MTPELNSNVTRTLNLFWQIQLLALFMLRMVLIIFLLLFPILSFGLVAACLGHQAMPCAAQSEQLQLARSLRMM